ncbi:MAG: hypothetical protein JWO44_2496 [Bacteroidetes bacterium]|nr:hypothetical protein [Bacteroidota bacterium]
MVRLNRYLYIVILLCFFLPFAEGCKWNLNSPQEQAAIEKARADSLGYMDPQQPVEEINSEPIQPFFLKKTASSLLLPGGDYSGIFLVLIGWKSLQGLTSLVPAFILLLVLVVVTNKKKLKNPRRIFIYSLTLTFFMLMFWIYNRNDLMYGYWLSLSFICINTVIAGINQKKETVKRE